MQDRSLKQVQTALADRYQVERLLGAGGMATVYLAFDTRLSRAVAIKVLRPELSELLGKERFLREIAITTELQHPNILKVLDSDQTGDIVYYTMAHVPGESLRDRLARDKPLDIDTSARIGREIAAALSYAHDRGIVHRDIKPGNILLDGDRVFVADFGLARAIERAGDESTLTSSGLAIGTPTYMAPEQATGQAPVDGRADIYSLGCLLYEMLAGDAPFIASTAQALLARHAAADVVPIRKLRPSVPEWLDRTVQKALQKIPADRFQSAAAFAAGLTPPAAGNRVNRLSRAVAALVVVGLIAAIAAKFVSRPATRTTVTQPGLDTTRLMIFPFDRSEPSNDLTNENQLLRDALATWSGVDLVDPLQVSDLMARSGSNLTLLSRSQLAQSLGAGRFIVGSVTRFGDSLEIAAALRDAQARGRQLAESRIRIRDGDADLGGIFDRFAARLLFGGSDPPAGVARRGTKRKSLPAAIAFTKGQSALEQWNLDSADAFFAEALSHDPSYPPARVWLTLVRFWRGAPQSMWQLAESRQVIPSLSKEDRQRLNAVEQAGAPGPKRSCAIWRQLATGKATDFAAWYGLAVCLRSDDGVVRDRRSPTGWAFRASYREAVEAYRRAFELLPSIHRALSGERFADLGGLFFVQSSHLRHGVAVGDTSQFLAYPELNADTLVFAPRPATIVLAGAPTTIPPTRGQAIAKQRQLLYQVASSWASVFRRSADAHEVLGLALQLLGAPSAIDTLHRARQLAANASDRTRIGISEAWTRLQHALADNPANLSDALVLVDSLLTPGPDSREARALVGLAVARGRSVLAAGLARRAAAVDPLSRDAAALLAFAAVGGPVDSLQTLFRSAQGEIERRFPPAERLRETQNLLVRSAVLAFPVLGRSLLPTGADPVLTMMDRATKGDSVAVRQYLAAVETIRVGFAPEELAPDTVYPEAWLLVQIGDYHAAALRLDALLQSVARLPLAVLAEAGNAGALLRAVALRSEVARRSGDPLAAARWEGLAHQLSLRANRR